MLSVYVDSMGAVFSVPATDGHSREGPQFDQLAHSGCTTGDVYVSHVVSPASCGCDAEFWVQKASSTKVLKSVREALAAAAPTTTLTNPAVGDFCTAM